MHLRVDSLLDPVGKNSPPDCFLPQTSSAPSLFESLCLFLPKQKAGLATCFSFWRRVRDFFGALPCTFASLRSLTPSAKTVHRTVFFRRLRLLPPCSNPSFVLPKQKAGLATCFSFWRRVRDSNPRYITYTAFRVLHLRPLGQLSVFQFVATCPITYRNVYYTKHFYTCQ